MTGHDSEENQKGDEFSDRRQWQDCSPMPAIDSAEPMSGNPGGPQSPCGIDGGQVKRIQPTELGNRVEPNAENESSDPSENLGMAVGLYPRG